MPGGARKERDGGGARGGEEEKRPQIHGVSWDGEYGETNNNEDSLRSGTKDVSNAPIIKGSLLRGQGSHGRKPSSGHREASKREKGDAEEGRRYEAQEEWKQEEMRRLRQQTRRDQDKRAQEQGRGEGRNRISSPSGAPLRVSTNLPVEPHAPAKLTEIVQCLTPSRLTVIDLVIPQGAGGTYTPSTHRVKPPGPIGAEAGKNWSCYEQEGPQDLQPLRSPAPGKHQPPG